jgi:hypothetical protein
MNGIGRRTIICMLLIAALAHRLERAELALERRAARVHGVVEKRR